ncbi:MULTISPECIES: DsbA family protein [unclassified Coleofasciculus]|uniref:DsbA family protein n=1 Tax=unclassified Coleofasciculus TaxID=2692782 RepID=UPI00187E3842|nr:MULTISPECIES: DsbA family protein [unclassified Coleofasciculus]MBE9127269.1 DsbA family protein [Coleofasciculus sp. LEGE 07081]MBE9150579.1 DsbA family protein [Coleofasciculus sp. LEGE 07092]
MPINQTVAYGKSHNPLDYTQTAETAQTLRPLVEITYYTDPLCSWSWALEPQWRRLRYEFGDQLSCRYSMGGLISDWQHFSDPLNDINRPVQMIPQWIQLQQVSGMPINERIWLEDPPVSSYPACIAVKAAEQQGLSMGEAYLRRLREAVMLEQRNIARREVLLELAAELAESTAFNSEQFQQEFDSQEAINAFREDIKDARYRDIGRFPALIMRPITGRAILLVGYRPYKELRKALAHVAPESNPVRSVTDAIAYASYWGRITAREVAEALDLELDATQTVLDDAVEQGILIKSDRVYLSSKNCTANSHNTPMAIG